MLRSLFAAALLLAFSTTAPGASFYLSHPATPYPPGCVQADPNAASTAIGTGLVIIEGFLQLTEFPGLQEKDLVLTQVIRRGCTETDRSVLYVAMEFVGTAAGFMVPDISAQIGETNYPLRLVKDPGTYDETRQDHVQGFGAQLYIVDGASAAQLEAGANRITPELYNGAFTLLVEDPQDPNNTFEIEIPEYMDDFKPARFPLSGRLSGTWIAENAVDQGFVLAFQEFADGTDITSLAFFSWYTFGPDGSTLWLTAANFYPTGFSSVELPIELVTNGVFLGSATADRSVVGDATLTALSCNRLQLDYDLTQIGLGSGTVFLTRLFSLETEGHVCRDVEARVEAL